jgi:hypothetical protein
MSNNVHRLKSWTAYGTKRSKRESGVLSMGFKANTGEHVVAVIIGSVGEAEPLTAETLTRFLNTSGLALIEGAEITEDGKPAPAVPAVPSPERSALTSSGWIAFSDRRPEPQYDRTREGPSHPDILVTNNLEARNRWGNMSHVWLVSMVHYHDDGPHIFNGRELAVQGEVTAFAQPCDQPLRCLTHWRPAVPEEWPAAALEEVTSG